MAFYGKHARGCSSDLNGRSHRLLCRRVIFARLPNLASICAEALREVLLRLIFIWADYNHHTLCFIYTRMNLQIQGNIAQRTSANSGIKEYDMMSLEGEFLILLIVLQQK